MNILNAIFVPRRKSVISLFLSIKMSILNTPCNIYGHIVALLDMNIVSPAQKRRVRHARSKIDARDKNLRIMICANMKNDRLMHKQAVMYV